MDMALALALGTALAAILSPILTTIINNEHQRKMEEMKLLVNRKIEVIEQYLDSTGNVIFNPSFESRGKYYEVQGKIYLYAPSETWENIREIYAKITISKDYDEAQYVFWNLSEKLSNHLALLKHKYRW